MKIKFSTPYAVRETARQIENILGLNLGIPMNAEISNLADDGEEREGTFTFHWEGRVHATGRVVVGNYESLNGCYQAARVVRIRFRVPYWGVNNHEGANLPLSAKTMHVLETVGAYITYTNDQFVLRLTEVQMGNARHFAERYPKVNLG